MRGSPRALSKSAAYFPRASDDGAAAPLRIRRWECHYRLALHHLSQNSLSAYSDELGLLCSRTGEDTEPTDCETCGNSCRREQRAPVRSRSPRTPDLSRKCVCSGSYRDPYKVTHNGQ